jgi:SPP1 gp7 family putative phage head morphogenesis protein
VATGKPASASKGRGAKALARVLRKTTRERFLRARKATDAYERQLKSVSREIGKLIAGMAPKGVVRNSTGLANALARYSDLLVNSGWAAAVSERMIAEVAQRDAAAWTSLGRTMGRELRREIKTAPTGLLMRKLLDEQVILIKSLPLVAAQRVHKLTIQAIEDSTRASEVAKEIMKSGQVSKSRAMLIARTEVARTASTLTESRAVHVGSEGYFWRTAMDSDVREAHKKLEGKFILWSDPPIASDDGKRAHAGQIFNCRCYPEPVLPDPEDI